MGSGFGMDGKWTNWYANGQIESEKFYNDDKEDGISIVSTHWYENGNIFKVTKYNSQGNPVSETQYFASVSGQKKSELNYKNKMLNGKLTRWHENGQIKSEATYKDGKQVSEKQVDEELIALKSAYVNNITARIKSFWRYQGADDDWNCDVFVQQSVEGVVEVVNIQNCNTGDSEKARAFKNSIERAVYKSSPLPSAPDEAVFNREILMHFKVN